jgi:cyclophilin family peptidyl-prolyl cis-trans isomerase
MKKLLLILLILMIAVSCASKKENVCVLETSMGTMVFKFFEEDAPITSQQFQKLVTEGFYDGKEFYRIVKGHVIQAGGGGEKIVDEFNKNLHLRGSVGLAHGGAPNSGDSAFYICLTPRTHLDGLFTVFGQLIEGEDVLAKIENVEVIEKFAGEQRIAFHEPKEPVIILKAFIEQRVVKP